MRQVLAGSLLILAACVTETDPERLVPGLDQKYATLLQNAEVLPCRYRRPPIGPGTTKRAGEYCLRPLDGDIETPDELPAGTQISIVSAFFEAPTTCVLMVGLPEQYHLSSVILRGRYVLDLLGRDPVEQRGRVRCQ